MPYRKYALQFQLLALTVFFISCSISRITFDKHVVRYSTKNSTVITELAEYSINYALTRRRLVLETDTLQDLAARKKFSKNGLGGLITVTFVSYDDDKMDGFPDSTVIFKQTTLRGITEIVYDFSKNEKKYQSEAYSNADHAFRKVSARIYYRRRPISMM